MNKRSLGLVILSIVFDFIEYIAIFFAMKALVGSVLAATVITVAILGIMLTLQIFSSNTLKYVLESDEETLKNYDKIKNEFDKISKKLDEEYGITGLSLKVVNGRSIFIGSGYTPAFNYKGIIAVADECNTAFVGGVIAHEAGHAISGISAYTFLQVRVTHFISSLLRAAVSALYYSKKGNKFLKVLACVVAIPYAILALPDMIALYPFMRADEFAANDFAVSLGYGEQLRCYYYSVMYDQGFMDKLIDLAHPPIVEFFDRINEKLELNEKELDVYSVGKSVYYIDAEAEDREKVLYDWYLYRESVTGEGYYKYMLGVCNEKSGDNEYKRSKAITYYSEAAEAGYTPALKALGALYKGEGSVVKAYTYYREYVMKNPSDKTARESFEEVKNAYFEGVYNCKLLSPAGKSILFPFWKARLEGGELVWVVSTGDDEYNTMKGTYEIADDSVTLTVINEGASMSFVSDECITRDVITFTGAIGKYSIVLTHDDQ